MRTTNLTSTLLLAAAMAFSVGARAADSDKAPAADVQADKAAATNVKPHSHVEEKTGMPQKAPAAKTGKRDASKDTGKHYHPRDGK